MKRIGALVVFGIGALVSVGVRAEQAPGYDLKAAFAETDANGDGAIEIDEFYERLVDVFFLGDTDKDGFFTEAEFVRVVVVKEDFAAIDKDGDGRVSRREFVGARLPVFMEIDGDGDSALSLAELNAALEGRASK